jgi:alanyl-tRNA synthetase
MITGADAFLLSDTYGFPLELTQELALERGYTVDVDGYEQALADAREKAQKDAKSTFSRGVDWAQYLDGVPPTLFVGYDSLDVVDPQIIKQIVLDDGRLVMIFDQTPFYAESGGQTGDRGVITFDDGSTKTITDVKKYGDVFLHFVE